MLAGLNLPEGKPLNETKENKTPFYLLGDKIFPLKTWLMRPFPGQNADEEQRSSQ